MGSIFLGDILVFINFDSTPEIHHSVEAIFLKLNAISEMHYQMVQNGKDKLSSDQKKVMGQYILSYYANIMDFYVALHLSHFIERKEGERIISSMDILMPALHHEIILYYANQTEADKQNIEHRIVDYEYITGVIDTFAQENLNLLYFLKFNPKPTDALEKLKFKLNFTGVENLTIYSITEPIANEILQKHSLSDNDFFLNVDFSQTLFASGLEILRPLSLREFENFIVRFTDFDSQMGLFYLLQNFVRIILNLHVPRTQFNLLTINEKKHYLNNRLQDLVIEYKGSNVSSCALLALLTCMDILIEVSKLRLENLSDKYQNELRLMLFSSPATRALDIDNAMIILKDTLNQVLQTEQMLLSYDNAPKAVIFTTPQPVENYPDQAPDQELMPDISQ